MAVTRLLFDMPPEIAILPRDHRGYPVPKFASWKDGVPNFVLADFEFMYKAIKEKLCWLCGGKLGTRLFFIVGPMCTITGVSAEPPCHMGCARFAVKNCPFMTKPLAKRADVSGMGGEEPAGVMLERNPGVTAMYETNGYTITLDIHDKPLIRMGGPKNITWWREGRPATGEEVLASIESGVPALYELAKDEGPIALHDLEVLLNTYVDTTLRRFLPPLPREVTKA